MACCGTSCLQASLRVAVEAQHKYGPLHAGPFRNNRAWSSSPSPIPSPPSLLPPPPSLLFTSSAPARNVRPKMTIYVCQELEQNRAPLQQKRDGGGDSSLCGELWAPLPNPGPIIGVGRVTGRCSSSLSPLAENVATEPISLRLRARRVFVKLPPGIEMF